MPDEISPTPEQVLPMLGRASSSEIAMADLGLSSLQPCDSKMQSHDEASQQLKLDHLRRSPYELGSAQLEFGSCRISSLSLSDMDFLFQLNDKSADEVDEKLPPKGSELDSGADGTSSDHEQLTLTQDISMVDHSIAREFREWREQKEVITGFSANKLAGPNKR